MLIEGLLGGFLRVEFDDKMKLFGSAESLRCATNYFLSLGYVRGLILLIMVRVRNDNGYEAAMSVSVSVDVRIRAQVC